MSEMRATGGNRFIGPASTRHDLVTAIALGIHDLDNALNGSGRALDIAALTVTTKRIRDGRISVTVSTDPVSSDD